MLRRQFEEKRKEQILKYQVPQELFYIYNHFVLYYHYEYDFPLIYRFQASNVYVKNIDDEISDDELRLHFSQCGTITSAKIMRDDKGLSRGYGFVCFSTPEEANKAVYTFHGGILLLLIFINTTFNFF